MMVADGIFGFSLNSLTTAEWVVGYVIFSGIAQWFILFFLIDYGYISVPMDLLSILDDA